MAKDANGKDVREGKFGMSFRVTSEVRKLIRHYMVEHDLQLDEVLLRGLVCSGVLPPEVLEDSPTKPIEPVPEPTQPSAAQDGGISAESLEALLRS